jgi:hypothetical protein
LHDYNIARPVLSAGGALWPSSAFGTSRSANDIGAGEIDVNAVRASPHKFGMK